MTGRISMPVQDQMVDFLDFLISLDDPDPASAGGVARRTITLNQIIQRAQVVRDAIGAKVALAAPEVTEATEAAARFWEAVDGAGVRRAAGGIRALEDLVRTALDHADADEPLPFGEDDYQSGRAHAVHEVRMALEGGLRD